MIQQQKILLVGCGKMGGAMLKGWLRRGIDPSGIVVVDPAVEPAKCGGVLIARDSTSISRNFKPDIVVLAVKPKLLSSLASQYLRYKDQGAVFISIVAGKTLKSLERMFGVGTPIIRAMPNLPAIISKGVTVAITNGKMDNHQKRSCSKLLEAVGKFHWVDDENMIDTVTAVSGSGPAYIFYLIECVRDICIELGLSEEISLSLAYETVNGSAILAHDSNETIETMRKRVTSPEGTTEAGLKILMGENGLKDILRNTILAAENRSKELNG